MKNFSNKEVSIKEAIVITTVVTIICSIGVYYLAKDKITKEESALRSQISGMQKELFELKSKNQTAEISDTNNTKNIADSTASQDWKTYTNTKYGYSLSYPKNVTIVARDENLNSTTVSPEAAEIILSSSEAGTIFHITMENLQFNTDEIKNSFPETDPKDINLISTTIAGNTAYQAKYHAQSDEMVDTYFVKSPSGAVLRIGATLRGYSTQGNNDTQKILSSLKFIE